MHSCMEDEMQCNYRWALLRNDGLMSCMGWELGIMILVLVCKHVAIVVAQCLLRNTISTVVSSDVNGAAAA